MLKQSKYIFWAIAVLCILALWAFQYKIAVNVPWWDDFHGIILPVFNLFQDVSFYEKIKLFFSLNNEHRVVNDRIFLLIIYLFTGHFELKALALLGYINLIAIFILLFKVAKSHISNLLYLLPFVFLIFHAQYYESLQSLMVPFQNFSVILYVFLSFYFLIFSKKQNIWPAFTFAILAIFSHGNGILAFLIGIIILAFNLRFRQLITWTILSSITILLYFYGYKKPEWSSGVSVSEHPFEALKYVLEFFGAYALNITNISTTVSTGPISHYFSLIFGLLLISIFLLIALKKYPFLNNTYKEAALKLRTSKADQFFVCVFGFVFATGLMIGISRTGFDMLSRYTINSSFMVIAVYFLVISNSKNKKSIAILSSIGTFFILFLSYFNNFDTAIYKKNNAITDGINFRNTGTWSNQYFDEEHVMKLNPLLIEPLKDSKYSFPPSILDDFMNFDTEYSAEKLEFGITDGLLQISGVLNEEINSAEEENGIYFTLENNENQFIFPARNPKNNLIKALKLSSYFSDRFVTSFPVKLIPKSSYKLFKIEVKGNKVTKYDLNKTYGPSPIIY
ncbi:hypothetical protein EGI22_06900 [Lacihabitans sp. LS3-19]|uniref:hypothetical protein n=1 Tax=Lacihabitans sp. LS3-19 TaxID=2487335 RepID=UPI0020CCBAA2|nr:hypothetical protein [Lacihabitans sp. LS3-19]MCP9767635.1 hypothetical protein [Lacihabitans sp. LS3-19]